MSGLGRGGGDVIKAITKQFLQSQSIGSSCENVSKQSLGKGDLSCLQSISCSSTQAINASDVEIMIFKPRFIKSCNCTAMH